MSHAPHTTSVSSGFSQGHPELHMQSPVAELHNQQHQYQHSQVAYESGAPMYGHSMGKTVYESHNPVQYGHTSYQQVSHEAPVYQTQKMTTTTQHYTGPTTVQYSQQNYGARLASDATSITAGVYSQPTVSGHAVSELGYTMGHMRSVMGEEKIVGTRVVGVQRGEERVVSVTERVDEARSSVVRESIVEHEVRVPKRVIREEIIEKIIVVPEKVIQEEIVEGTQMIKERIIEISKPVIMEKVVEYPEIETIERIIEVPEIQYQERIKHVQRVVEEQRMIHVPKIIHQEKIVEVPETRYRDVPVERIVEVPVEQIEVRRIPVEVPQYVDKPVPEYVNVEVPRMVERKLPVPVEAITTFEFKLPQLRPRYAKVTYPVYLPRFIEVPVARELLDVGLISKANGYGSQLHMLHTAQAAVSLCEIENLAATIKREDVAGHLSKVDLQSALMHAWQSGSLLKSVSHAPGSVHPSAYLHQQVRESRHQSTTVPSKLGSRSGSKKRSSSKKEHKSSHH